MERIPKQVVDDILSLERYIKAANDISLKDMVAKDGKGVNAFERLKKCFHDKIIRVLDDKYIDLNFRSICATIEYIGDYKGCKLCTNSIGWYPEEY
jgi:hypothetical protein